MLTFASPVGNGWMAPEAGQPPFDLIITACI
jgi:hypothetical protein